MDSQRILHIVGGMDRAGAETMLMNLYRNIDRTKFQFDFVYFTDKRCDYDDEIEQMGGVILRICVSNPASRFFALFNILRKGSWDVVHAHTLFSSGLHLLSAKLAKVPLRIAHSHNTSDNNSSNKVGRTYQNGMRWLLSWVATDYIGCGKAAADYLFPNNACVSFMPNAIDINQFISAKGSFIRDELIIDRTKIVIIQIGRFMPVKNYNYSVDIAVALKNAKVDFKMLFVGTGPEQNAVKAKVSQCKLESYIHFLDVRTDIPELMAAADVMLMPSLHEGFPVVLVESQAVSLPAVVASTVSREVDLGIGLIEFVNLDSSIDEWVEKIKIAAQSVIVSEEDRFRTLEDNGFLASSSAKRLMSIYEKS